MSYAIQIPLIFVLITHLSLSTASAKTKKNVSKNISAEKVLAITTQRTYGSAINLLKLKLSSRDQVFLDKVAKQAKIPMGKPFEIKKMGKNSYSLNNSKNKFNLRLKGKEISYKGKGFHYKPEKSFQENYLEILKRLKPVKTALHFTFIHKAVAKDPLSGLDNRLHSPLVREAVELSVILGNIRNYYKYDPRQDSFQLIANATTERALSNALLGDGGNREISSINCDGLGDFKTNGALVISYFDGSQVRVSRSQMNKGDTYSKGQAYRNYYIDTWAKGDNQWRRTYDAPTYARNSLNNGSRLPHHLEVVDHIESICNHKDFNNIVQQLKDAETQLRTNHQPTRSSQ